MVHPPPTFAIKLFYKIMGKDNRLIKVGGGQAAFSWFAGWLFTIGFLHLAFWKGVLAVVLWPYYIGLAVSTLAQR
jgi:hypothetical protein